MLFDLEKLDVEEQSAIGGNGADGHRTIAHLRRDSKLALATDFHACNAFIPALDDFASAESEGKGLAAVERRIELSAVGEGTGIVDGDLLAGDGFVSVTDYSVFDLELCGLGHILCSLNCLISIWL